MIKEIIATALLSANVGAQPVAQNLATSRDDIVYKYDTNEVDNTSEETTFNSLIEGNIYKLNIYGRADVISSTYIGDYITTSIDIGNYASFGLSFSPGIYGVNRSIYLSSNTTYTFITFFNGDSNNGYISIRTPRTYVSLYAVISNKNSIVIDNANYTFNACPTDKIPYEVVSTKPNNIYTYMYDFYLSLFDNTQLDSMTWTIGTQAVSMAQWLAHTLCIITIILGVVLLILLIRWLFRVFSGLIQWAR